MALCANVLVVEIAKIPAHAPPPACGAANGKRAVAAYGEAACVDGAGLGRAVELELAVGHDGASPLKLVVEDAVFEGAEQATISRLLCGLASQ